MENIIDGYNIDKNQSGLVQLSNEDLHAQLLIWMDDPEQSPQCIYVKIDIAQGLVTREQCCAVFGVSWGAMDHCEILACDELLPDFVDDMESYNPEVNVIENNGDQPFRTCMNYGPNYYRTFDGLEYRFAGRCTYVVFRDRAERTVRVTHVDCEAYSSCRKRLEIVLNSRLRVVAIGSDIVVYDKGQPSYVYVNETNGYSSPGSVPIEKIGVYYYLEYGSLRLRWDDESSWFLTLDEAPRDPDSFSVGGLCGNYDRDPHNDMRKMTGQVLDNPAVFGNSWTVHTEDPCPDASMSGYECRTDDVKEQAKSACKVLLKEPFISCHTVVAVQYYYHRCLNDYCAALDYTDDWEDPVAVQEELDSILCVMADSYTVQCAFFGKVISWRSEDFCR
ncbi:hypothetical protein LSH36_586g01000 [Paralvinella palmiformis]|uniref:VWFD domain-containing protein n=1 Tax=Paralvinella palmiformis TaxID=53620 RepID=A0AAD9J5V5_9ANNE|nr:hypothetical protein LSH36_586g01000 [Paralvinella palmiformis]